MPNWVFNYVSIEGDKETVDTAKKQLNTSFMSREKDWKTGITNDVTVENPVFSFFNIIRPPLDKMEEYHETHGFSKDGKTGDTEWNWYNFNNREWGTKWDVAGGDETTIVAEYDGYVQYYFDTAWSPPIRALIHLSNQYPTLTIKCEWEEEQGFGSVVTIKNGEDDESNAYDWKCFACCESKQDTDKRNYDNEEMNPVCDNCVGVSA